MNAMDRRILAEDAVLAEPRPTVLRGAQRPDLVRDEVLLEIFTASAKAHAEKPAFLGLGRRTREFL